MINGYCYYPKELGNVLFQKAAALILQGDFTQIVNIPDSDVTVSVDYIKEVMALRKPAYLEIDDVINGVPIQYIIPTGSSPTGFTFSTIIGGAMFLDFYRVDVMIVRNNDDTGYLMLYFAAQLNQG